MSRETNRLAGFDSLLAARDDEREVAFETEDEEEDDSPAFAGALFSKPETEADRLYTLNVIHDGLTRLHFTRTAIEHALRGRTLDLRPGYQVGRGRGSPGTKDGKRYWIAIDPPMQLSPVVPWARPTPSRDTIAAVRFISVENKKMQCPSLALPAGALEMGGSCIGAGAAQTSVVESGREKYERQLGEEVDLTNTICGRCYASVTTNAQHGTVQLEELCRYWWLVGALRETGIHATAKVVIDALEAQIASGWPVEHHPGFPPLRFFRLHDSGDFFSPDYAKMWIEVVQAFPEVLFWAPTRTWATHGWRSFWREARIPENLIVRPSAYHFDDPAPRLQGMAAGSTSLYAVKGASGKPREQEVSGKAEWNCQVYRAEKGAKNCRAAVRPLVDDEGRPVRGAGGMFEQGDTGCRTCWLYGDVTVNYTAHG